MINSFDLLILLLLLHRLLPPQGKSLAATKVPKETELCTFARVPPAGSPVGGFPSPNADGYRVFNIKRYNQQINFCYELVDISIILVEVK